MKSLQMKNLQSLVVSLLLMAFVALACKNSDNQSNLQINTSSPSPASTKTPETKAESPKSDIQPLDKGVVLNFRIETNSARKPKIVGETNLPDGTELMGSIDSKTIQYNASSKFSVQNGRFESETFSKNGSDLEAGQYTAKVLMPIAQVQTPEVRAVIGQNGENLKGSLVEKGSLGVTVSAKQPFQLKADSSIVLAENKSEIADAKKNASTLFDALKRLEQQGRSMEALRSNKTIENIRQCGNLMRERQPIADDLRSKAESLPRPFTFWLTPVAIELKLCVSCASSAFDNCNRAKSSLDEAAKEMQKNK